MNDKFQSLYNYLKSEGLTDLDQNSFYAEYSSNSNKMGELHSYLKQNNMTDLDVNSFSSEYFDVKKKDVSDASLEQKKEPSSSDTGEKVKQTPLVLSGAKSDGYYSYSGRKGAVYQKKDGEWFVDPKANGEFVKIETNKDSRIKELEKNAVENSSYKFISGEKSAVDTLSSQAKKTEEELSDRRANLEKTIDSINGKNLPMYEEVTRELLTKISDTYTNDLLEIEETGFGYDAVSVKNKLNGKKVTISLGDGGERSEREANLLKGFIKMSLASEPLDRKQKQLNELMQKQSNGEVVDYMTQEPIQEKIDRIKLEMEPLKRNLMDQALSDDYMASAYFSKAEIQNASVKFSRLAVTTADIKAAKEEADANIAWQKQKLDQGKELYDNGELTKDQFQAEYIGPYNKTAESENTKLNQMVESLSKDISDTTSDMEKLNVMAGMNYSVQEKRGSVLGGVGRSFVSGIEKPVRFLIGGEKGLLTDTFAPETTTEEFMTSDDRSMVTNALFGITESFGTALVGVAGGPKGVTASFFGASYVDIKDEMDSPEMAGLPEHEKVILATIYGSTVGFLEKFGITKAMSKTPIGKNLVNVIMRNTFKSIPKGLSAEATEALIKSNIKTALTKYGINVIGGALVEGSTELAQELAGVSIKETYDLIKGADYFESPENLGDLVGRLSESFLLGAIGGGMMTGASQMSHTRKDMMTANQLLAAEALMKDPDLKSIWSMNIKNRVLSGEITKEEGYAEIKRITEVVGTVDKIPMDLNADEKYSSYKLLVEKEQLEAETKGYPESVVAAKLDRIKAIDEELKTISYAVQERKTAQVPVESEAGSGQDVRTGGEEFTKVAFPNISGTEATQRTQEWDEKVKEFLPESKFKTEEEFKSSLEKGNWGMLTAENPDATQVSDADNAAQNEKAVQWLKDKGYDPQTIFGKYDNSEVSFFVENLSESDAVAFANEFKQESVATDKGLVYADGKMNPRVFGEEKYDAADNYYSTIKVGGQNVSFQVEYDFNSEVDTVQNRETSKNLVTEENVDSIYESTLSEDADGTKTGVVKAVRSVIKSLPGVKVFLHNNQDEFIKGVAEASGESTDIIKSEEDVFRSEGQFVNGEIHIDLSNSNPSTVYHEAFHVAINQKGLSVDLAQGLKESISDKTLIERIDNFISMYAESDRKEEMISELGAIMADAESELTTTGAHKFKQFINNLAKKLGLPPIFSETAGAQEIVNFINTVSKNMREGRSIDTETVSPSASRKKKISEPNKAVVDAKQKYDLSIERGNSIEKAQQSAINDLKKNDWYKDATDIERESALRDLRKQLGLKEKAAPSVAKVTKDKAKKVIVNEATALKDQIRFEARAARESAADLKGKQRAIASVIKGMVREGKIKSTQGAILVDKLSKLNVDNPVMVGRFIDYAGRLFKDAEYKAKLDTAFTTRRKIKAMMKRDNQAEVVSVAKEFSSIDPSLVEDVDAYNDMAVSVLEGLTKSRISGTEVIVKNRANIKAVSEYTSNELEAQEEYKRQEIMGLHSDLVEAGVISADMSSKEMNALINSIKSEEDIDLKDKEKYVRDYANSVFDTFSAVIDEILETGKDPITGESFDITEDQRSVMKELIGIDTKLMPIKDLIATIDSMNNFITNGITSGVEAKVAYYRGVKSAADLRNQGVKARSMKFFGSKKGATDKVSVGRFWMEQMVTLPMMFDVMFKGVRSSINVMERMGINSFVKGVSTSNKKWTNITDSYTENFKKAKPNGKKFNDVSNIYERGMFAFLSRQNADLGESDFARRVKLVKDSIDRLLKHGDNDQIKKGEVYQEVFDKLGLNDPNTNILDVEARVDKVNREAVKWWVNEWSQHYSDLSDVSNSIYNTVLGKDLNYTPDKFSTIDPTAKSAEEILEDKGGAFSGMLDFVYDKKTGVLMPATNPQGMESGRYVDLDFDSVNAGALKGALIDINTASSIKQISGFLDSKDFSSIVPLVRDRRLFESRIKSSIFRGRNKMPMSNDQIGVLERMSRIVSTVGSSKALGGILQVPKQTIPVAMNTLINAGANNFNPAIALNKDFNEFINKSGYSIANRGIESLNAIETANKITEKYSKAGKVLEGVEKVNQFWLKAFLSKPDVYIARASFHAYYIQDLKAQGVSTKGIDWSTHEINHDAATYAQHMIDRQQHISEGSLAGELFASEEPMRKIVRNVAMPFVSFVTNQKTRMYSDISTIMSKDSSVQDKAIAGKSLGGLTVEIMAFNLIAWGVRELIYQAAAETVGREITDEEKEKRARQQLQYVSANVSKDILSPLPQTDGLVVAAMNEVIDLFAKDDTEGAKKALEERNKALQLKDREPLEGEEAEKWMDKWMEERKFKLSNFEKNGLGVYTIGSEKFSELATINDMANGSFEKENPFGGTQTRYVREEDRKLARQVSILEAAHLAGLLPNEIGSYTRYIIKNIEKNSISENAHNKIKQLKSDLGKKELSIVEDYLASSKRKLEGIKDELDTIEIFGGLETEQQQRDYVKVLEAKGEVTYPDYELIMSGRTSELLK